MPTTAGRPHLTSSTHPIMRLLQVWARLRARVASDPASARARALLAYEDECRELAERHGG